MSTVISQLNAKFRTAMQAAWQTDADPVIAPAQNEKFGDYQANAAMGLAKSISDKTGQKTPPRAVAERIVAALELGEMASEVTIAGPGFINVRLSPTWMGRQLHALLNDPHLGVEPAAKPETIVVDYSGPNVAKEMHVGHLRSTIIGDCLGRVLAFEGHRVIRQNHIGDWGTQFGMLIQLLGEETSGAGGQKLADLEAFYRSAKERFDADPAFADRSRAAVVRLQGGDTKARQLWQAIVEETRRHYQSLYERLGVLLVPADERGESNYNAMLPAVVDDLKREGLAVESQGATAVFIDGPDKSPVIVQKTGGGYLYATTDLAAIRYRVDTLGANHIIYCHDSRQAQHFSQVFAIARKMGWAQGVTLEIAAFGTMLGEDNRPFKTRSGGTVKLKDLLDEAIERALLVVTAKNPNLPEDLRRQIARAVGIGAVKYADLSKDRNSDYVFSFDKMLALDGNTAPYLQYAHARTVQIQRKAQDLGIATDVSASIDLQSGHELAIAKQLLRFADLIDLVSRELKPHHLCTYLYELATRFSGFFENCPVVQSDEPLRSSRLMICQLTQKALASGLALLGIEHPDQM